MERKLLLINSIRTPDGTVLHSRGLGLNSKSFDYHQDETNGKYYHIDGGLLRKVRPNHSDFEELSVEDDGTLVTARQHLEWKVKGKGWVKLKDLDDEKIVGILELVDAKKLRILPMYYKYFEAEVYERWSTPRKNKLVRLL